MQEPVTQDTIWKFESMLQSMAQGLDSFLNTPNAGKQSSYRSKLWKQQNFSKTISPAFSYQPPTSNSAPAL